MSISFEKWSSKYNNNNTLSDYIIKYTGCSPYSGCGIKFYRQQRVCVLRSNDNVKYYEDNLSNKDRVLFTLQGKVGNQDENEKKFNEPLLNPNKTKHIYLYRVNKNSKQNKYTWYGKYQIVDKNTKLHPDENGDDRTIIVLTLQKIQ